MHSGFSCMNGNFLSRQRERLRGAAAGREFFCFFDPDETGDLAGESREPEKICETGKNRGKEWSRVT